MTKDEALKMAIEALETAEVQSEYDGLSDMIFKAINACKEALAEQPTQEPMTHVIGIDNDGKEVVVKLQSPLYTYPKQWQGLSDVEIDHISMHSIVGSFNTRIFARAIEAKLREKNG